MSWARIIYYILLSAMGEDPFQAKTTGGLITTILMVVLGVFLVIHVLEQVSGSIIEDKLNKLFKKNRYIPKNMKDHVIVCGYGNIGREVVGELEALGNKIAIITNDLTIEERDELKAKGIGFLISDLLGSTSKNSSDEILSSAKIMQAQSIILTLDKESDNAFLSLTAKDINKEIRVISHTNDYSKHMIDKFKKAGTSIILSSEVVGGHLLAMAGLKPLSTDFMQDVSTASYGIDIREYTIHKDSGLVGKKINDSYLHEKTNASIIGLRKGDDLVFNPGNSSIYEPGDVVIAIGDKKDLEELNKLTGV